MTDEWFFLGLIHESALGEHLQNSCCCYLDYIQLAKQMFFVLFVYLSLADENMVERFFDEHVQNIVIFVFEQ